MKDLGNRQSTIFTPGGKKQEIPKILVDLEQVEKDLRAVEKDADRYTEETRQRDTLVDEIAELETQQAQLLSDQEEKALLQSQWSRWTALQEHVGPLGARGMHGLGWHRHSAGRSFGSKEMPYR